MNKLLKNSLLGLTLALGLSTVAMAEHETESKGYYEYRQDQGQYRYDQDRYNQGEYDDEESYWIGRRQIVRSALELQREANHFFEITDDMRGYSYISDDARELTRDARHLWQEIQEGTHPRHLARDFNNLRNSFRILQSNFYRTHRIYRNPHALRDFRDLEQAWVEFQYRFTGRFDSNRPIYGYRVR